MEFLCEAERRSTPRAKKRWLHWTGLCLVGTAALAIGGVGGAAILASRHDAAPAVLGAEPMDHLRAGLPSGYFSEVKETVVPTVFVTRLDARIVIPGVGSPITDGTVIFDSTNRILFAGSRALVPPGMIANKTYSVEAAMPGLWDCHTHFAGGATKTNFKVDGAYPVDHVAFYDAIEELREALNMGITSVREVGGPFGQSLNILLQAGRIKGPNLHYSGRCIGITSGHTDSQLLPLDLMLKLDGERQTGGTLCDGVAECLKRTRENLRLQADVIKIMTTGGVLSEFDQPIDAELSLEEVQAITADAKRARRAVAAHAHGSAGIQTAIDGGVTTIEHGSYLTEEQARQIIEKKYMVLTPTLTIQQEYFNGTSRPPFLDDNQWRKGLDVLRSSTKNVQMAIRMGVPIVAGTDCPKGCAEVGREVSYLHMFGMTPLQAIRAATGDAPRCMGLWGMMPKSGRLEHGYEADVIALNVNPLDDLSALTRSGNITHVWKAGWIMKEPVA